MTLATILGLRRVGPARPVACAALDAAERREGLRFPPSFRRLLEAWGAHGQLCGFTYVLDPTDPAPHAVWRFYRAHLRGDALQFRRDYQQWTAVDDATFGRLVVWADLDGKTFAWDAGRPDARGEYPVWFLDREGGCAVLAARSLEDLVADFVRGGGLDRVHPPAEGGSWEATDTYVTERPANTLGRLLAALHTGDDASAEAALADHRAAVSGYEASAQLVAGLWSRDADGIPAARRAAWLERAVAWAERCAPGLTARDGVPAVLAAVRAGRPLDALVPVAARVDAACGPLSVTTVSSRWNASHLDCVVRNVGPVASAPCVLHATAEDDGGPSPFAHALEVPALEPGAEHPMAFGWPASETLRVRIELRPA